jgi:hypothetical protein
MSVFAPYLALATGLAAKFRRAPFDARDWRIAVLEAERIRLSSENENLRAALVALKEVVAMIGARRQAEAIIDAKLYPALAAAQKEQLADLARLNSK